LSKKRNARPQTVLIEAARLAVRYNEPLRALYERCKQRRHAGRRRRRWRASWRCISWRWT
jgi:hypothetical protein